VRRLIDEVLARRGANPARVETALALSDDHAVPEELVGSVHALLGG